MSSNLDRLTPAQRVAVREYVDRVQPHWDDDTTDAALRFFEPSMTVEEVVQLVRDYTNDDDRERVEHIIDTEPRA